MQIITAEQVTQLIDSDDDFLLINTLDEEDFGGTHIPGSINLPESQEDFVDQVYERAGSYDKQIVVYCASTRCQSSTRAAQKLEAAGFTHVYDFEAGAEGWKDAGKNLALA